MNKKIAVYGGAFDPPQLAHETIGAEIIKRLGLEKLYVVPSGPRPDKAYKTSLEYRRKIMQIFVESIDSKKAELCDVFIDGKIINTTLNVDKYFKEKLGYSPYQIFGSDLIDTMWQWDPTGEVAMKLPKIIIIRPRYEIDYSKIANFILIDPFENVSIAKLSSTQVRENIKRRVFEGMNTRLAEFIKLNELYV